MWSFVKRFVTETKAGVDSTAFVALTMGVVFLVVGLIMGQTIVTQAATAVTGIGSFSGATAMKDLIPFIYYALLVIISVLMMGWGTWSMIRGKR